MKTACCETVSRPACLICGRMSYVSKLKFYILIDLRKLNAKKSWNYDWPEPGEG